MVFKKTANINGKLKMALISGAAHSIRYKELNPWATEEDVIRYVSSNSEKILEKIDKEF